MEKKVKRRQSDGSDRTGGRSNPGSSTDPPHPPRGAWTSEGYRELRSFRTAAVIYSGTVRFCEFFLDPHSHTTDQMLQSALSARRKIAEGYRASTVSRQSERRVVSVARARLDELLLDYEEFLRQYGLRQWAKDGIEARAVRAVGKWLDRADKPDYDYYREWLDDDSPEIVANTIICLIHQTNYLLEHLFGKPKRSFVGGGVSRK